MGVKNSAIIYTAYDYQTLQGVYLLSAWLNSPTEFERVSFEADKESNDAPQGIDDIICQRADGKTDFWQVKFTPSPEKNHLTWNWLLNRTGKTKRSRSILKKLSDAILRVSSDRLGNVILLTNKVPDRAMENCINGTKIEYSKIEPETQEIIVNQLGSEEIAISFFAKLDIQHSEGDYHTLDRTVRSELYKHSDDTGINRLLNRSRQWAMFKNSPTDDGWIYLHHVREILSSKRPEPIPEIFTVSPQYCLPDDKFHNDLINQICSSKGDIISLTGKPGIGKSTYLSYLCQTLEDMEVPLIRHHYFLSLGDTTDDRLSPRVVAESFLHQIQSVHHKANVDSLNPEDLREAIEKCAKYYQEQNKPFVVLIDGLDHVWRDNARNKKPLDEIFRQLLPIVENMVLLVGTQPVDIKLLPDLLLTFSPKKDWIWLPAMTGNSIFEFLKYQVDSGRIQLNCHEDQIEEEIQTAAEKLLNITTGYPLHVIYSYEFLAQNGKTLSSWEIEKLPPCSNNNIETYYQKLWKNLTHKQRDVLHLCSGFQFAWPRNAIGLILDDLNDDYPSVDAVTHMLFEGIAGIRPFHESLVVFVRNLSDHQTQINTLLPHVCKWLDNGAPSHLKDAWLWSSIARTGDTSSLREGISRDWLLDHLIEGFPIKTSIRLLSEAETYAFKELNYAEAYKHRALKTRLLNGPEFQTWDEPSLRTLSLVNASDSAIDQEISSQNEYSPTKLAILSIALWYRRDNKRAVIIAQKAIDRYRSKNKLLNSNNRQSEEAETTLIIQAGVLTDTLNYDALFKRDSFSNWPDAYVNALKEACITKRDIDLLIKARKNLAHNSIYYARNIELSTIRISIIEDADISARTEYDLFTHQKLSALIKIISKNNYFNIQTYIFEPQNSSSVEIDGSLSYHQWFFSSLITRLEAEGDFSWLPVQATNKDADISIHFNVLNELADSAAQKLITDDSLSFDYMCSLLPKKSLLDEIQWETRSADILFKREWIEISADCHLLTTKSQISLEMLDTVVDSENFRMDWLRLWYKDVGLKLLDDDAVKRLSELELARQSTELEETIEYSNSNLELAKIACRHGDRNLFYKHLRISWDYVLGYGHHKDHTIFDVLTAIKYLSTALPDEALKLLERISPIVFNVSEFTDGDGTRHSKHSISSLLASLNPQTAASIYEQELKDGEWYYSEETLSSLVKNSDFSLPIVRRLFLTGLHSDCYLTLQKLIDSDNQSAVDIAEEVENQLGIEIIYELKEEKTSNTSLEKININPADYPPQCLEDLIFALKGKYSTSDFWKVWYEYWVKQGKETELVDILHPIVSSLTDRLDDKRQLIDKLFISQKKLKGKTKAFGLLVAAHNAMNGWSDWYERSGSSLNRLKILSEVYPNRIDEFIKLTTEQPYSWLDKFGKLIIPNDKLVFLLTESGRTAEAVEFVGVMIDKLEEDTRNLSLNKPDWDWECDDTIEEALTKTLVSRLKLPIPSIKLWVIEQVTSLLIEQYPHIEDLVLEDLSSRLQESECVEVLSLILIAKDKGYEPPDMIGNYIKARSVLSDMILNDLDSSPSDYGEYASEFVPIFKLTSDNHQFDYFHGTHIPQLYDTLLKAEERRTGIPWTSFFRSEWNNTFDYCPLSDTSIDYFLNADRSRSTGQFYTTASHRGRSAFLRTIEIAKHYFGMPVSYAKGLATAALPIEPAYINMSPLRPDWLSVWKDGTLPTKENISDYIKSCINEFSSQNEFTDLAALSFPIKIDDSCWIEITALKAITNQSIPSEFDIKERSHGVCIGNELERQVTYEYLDSEKDLGESSILLTGTTYPVLRYGHWHSDLEARGLYVPISRAAGKSILAKSANEVIEFEVDNLKIGYSSYWNNYWKPIHPKQLRSLCGTYTTLRKERYSKWVPSLSAETRYFYTCKARILSSEESFKEFDIQDISFIISDTGL